MAGPLSRTVGLADADLPGLVAELARRTVTLGTAESLTGGLLAAVLTEVPGASAVLRGGLVVYATDLKHSLAGVDNALLDERGPVDPDVAIALADGARTACGATVGVGLTGVAGPDEQHGIPVGTWYVAAVGAGFRLLTAGRPEDLGPVTPALSWRDATRFAAVRAAIALLAQFARTG